MKIAVWRSGHEIADTIASAAHKGLMLSWDGEELPPQIYDTIDLNKWTEEEWQSIDVHIGYGILRGMDNVYMAARRAGKPFICLDRGYWRPGHYDGYYRISLNGTQQTTGLDKLEPDYDRWAELGLVTLPKADRPANRPKLICPPTEHVRSFFSLGDRWEVNEAAYGGLTIIRTKDCGRSLECDLDICRKVYTFNSSVGWEALRQGIPVISDENHSFVGGYQKQVDGLGTMDIKSRLRMFAVMSSLQLNIAEIKSGKIWQLINRLLSTSDSTTGKQLPVT